MPITPKAVCRQSFFTSAAPDPAAARPTPAAPEPAPLVDQLRIEVPGYLNDAILRLIHTADRIASAARQVHDLLKTALHRRILVHKPVQSRSPARYRCPHHTKPIAGEYCSHILKLSASLPIAPEVLGLIVWIFGIFFAVETSSDV